MLAGAVADGVFRTGDGVPIRLPAGLEAAPTHAVLRAARLTLGAEPAPQALIDVPVTVTARAFLGEAHQLRVEGAGLALDVLSPVDPPPPPIGARVRLAGGADAVRFLSDPGA